MKIISLIVSIITGLLLLFTLICGLWIKANKTTDLSSLNFHTGIGIASVIFGFLTVVLLIILAVKQ